MPCCAEEGPCKPAGCRATWGSSCHLRSIHRASLADTVTRPSINPVCCEGNKREGKWSLVVFCPQMWAPKIPVHHQKTFVHRSTEILRLFLLRLKSRSFIYTFTVRWREVGNGVGCLRYSTQCSEHASIRGFPFKKTWWWLYCILTVKVFFPC